jgi:hypothetical protein
MPDIPDIPLTLKVSGLASRSAARRLPDIPDEVDVWRVWNVWSPLRKRRREMTVAREVWEPVVFEEGQRVRVRLSGECRSPRRGHPPLQDGMTGVIQLEQRGRFSPQLWEETQANGHRYIVVFDEPYYEPLFKSRCDAAIYAGSELIPLED